MWWPICLMLQPNQARDAEESMATFGGYIARWLRRHGLAHYVNIVALALALTAAIYGHALYRYESRYDSWHRGADDLYRIEIDIQKYNGTPRDNLGINSPPALAAALAASDAPVLRATRLSIPSVVTLTLEDSQFSSAISFVDTEFFEMFDLPFLHRQEGPLLRTPHSVVLTREEAFKLFGESDPTGREITLDTGASLLVEAVLDDLPGNTHFRFFGMIGSTENPLRSATALGDEWGALTVLTYIQLASGIDAALAAKKIQQLIDSKMDNKKDRNYFSVRLVHIEDIHFRPIARKSFMKPDANTNFVINNFTISVGLLFISIVNFLNHEIYIIFKNIKNYNIRIIFGASIYDFTTNNILDGFINSTIIITVCIIIISITSKYYMSMTNINVDLRYIVNFLDILAIFLAGAIFLTALHTLAIRLIFRRGIFARAPSGSGLARPLTGLQFMISVIVIISALTVFLQTRHLTALDRGVSFESIQQLRSEAIGGRNSGDAAAALGRLPGIAEAAATSARLPITKPQSLPVHLYGRDLSEGSTPMVDAISAGPGFDALFDIMPLAGRWFSNDRAADELRRQGRAAEGAAILSASALKMLGFQDPEDAMGQRIKFFNPLLAPDITLAVIGVVKDINWYDGRITVPPVIYIHAPSLEDVLFFSAMPGMELAAADAAKQMIDGRQSGALVTIDDVQKLFDIRQNDENNRFRVFALYAVLMICISCVGFYNMTSRNITRREKEIAIRKLFGSSMFQSIYSIIIKESQIIFIAILIGTIIGLYYNNNWLGQYFNRIDMPYTYIMLAVIASLVISLFTISGLVVHAVRKSPVDALRTEG